MQAEPQVSAIAHVVQLAVAPVFLLSGVAAMLALFVGLVYFLREIFVATRNLRIGTH